MTLSFQNKGLLDLAAVTTFGVSVKEKEDAIGFFGTGLKYAIAVSARLGGQLTLYHGLQRIEFKPSTIAMRGKSFASLVMQPEGGSARELPFTLELGKLWEPWMAFREFYCNGLDEPDFQHGLRLLRPREGYTTLVVENCPELEKAYKDRAEFILETPPAFDHPEASIHATPGRGIYYRGVLVHEQAGCQYSYNVKKQLTLTEDRTLKDSYSARNALGEACQALTDSTMCARIVAAACAGYGTTAECHFIWSSWNPTSPEFTQALRAQYRKIGDRMPEALRNILKEEASDLFEPKPVRLGEFERRMIERAKAFLLASGHDLSTYEIVCVENLGEGILGQAKEGKIWLSRICLDKGTKIVAGTLLEEYLHNEHGFDDCSRAFQDFLLDRYITLAERHIFGEPL